ncbi:transcription termination/antitermination protein NusG [Clostridiales bacterium]|nr:transcription termination/antitermination protein NusG [Clostridiales bacterium]
MGWHGIFVESGREDDVCMQMTNLLKHLNFTDYELLVPKRKLKEKRKGVFVEVIKTMFPGYVLIKTNNVWDIFNKTRHLNSIYKFLHSNSEMQEIRLEEIANIVYMVDEEGVIGISDIYVENDRIVVTKGPLMNYDGFVKKVDRRNHRVKVLFMFNSESHFIDISVNLIDKFQHETAKEIPFFTSKYYL